MVEVEAVAQPAAVEPPGGRPRWPGWVAAGLSVAAGLLLLLAFPPFDRWWTAPVGVALLAVATHRRGLWAGAGLGMLAGLALFVPLLAWTGLHVGAVWLILPVGEAAYMAALGAVSALTSPLVDRWRWLWPGLTGVLWVTQEALRDRTPFGGFPWGRLAFSQADSPLLRLAGLGGAPLTTFGVGVAGGLLAVGLWPRWGQWVPAAGRTVRTARVGGALTALGLALAWVLAPLLIPTAPAGEHPVTVAIVQGNVPRLGLDFNAQRRAVLDNHVAATLDYAQRVRAGTAPRADLVVWPENASDIDPLANADAYGQITAAVDAVGVPILVGGLLDGPGDRVRNVGIVWAPGRGPGATYIKRHPVPFAEYMPLRPLARALSDKADLVTSDFVAGPAPGVLTVGPVTVGDVICFEVAYDGIVRDTVTGGGQLLVVQTNNATFNPAEARQQLAMVRLRAVEHGRPALMASTVGVSAFVDPDGRVHDATSFNTTAVTVRELRAADARTMATAAGIAPELVLVAAAIVAVVAAIMIRMGPRRRKVEE